MATPSAPFQAGAGIPADSDVIQPQNPFSYSDETALFESVKSAFEAESQRVAKRREVRKNRINVAELRSSPDKPLLSDETVIPDRTIDYNVRIEKAPYVKVIEQSTTIFEFEDTANPGVNFTPLSAWHTRLVRTGEWKRTKFLTVDSLLLHGCAYREVIFTPDAPCKTTEEYIRREHLIFPPHATNLESCGRIYRAYQVTKSQFEDLSKKFEFDEAQVKFITDNVKGKTDAFYIFKCFMRDASGVIHIAWRGDAANGARDYLKAPIPYEIGLYNFQPGAQPTPRRLKQYPLFPFPYHIEEDEQILEIQGRAALDLSTQDALTSLISATVNGTVRASRFFPTRKTTPGDTPKNEALFPLRHGHIYEGDISAFQPAYPNTIAVSIAGLISSRKAQEIGATDYAAMNRQDTRKTATELIQAQETADSLSAPNISLYTLCEYNVESLRWQILLSQIRLEYEMQQMLQVPPEAQQYSFELPPVPIEQLLSPTLKYTMAADSQVVRRAQRQSRYIQYWPVVAATPYGLPFLETMLSDIFPEEFLTWQQQINQNQQQQQLLQQALPALMQLTPEQAQQIGANPEQYKNFLDTVGAAANPQQPPANG